MVNKLFISFHFKIMIHLYFCVRVFFISIFAISFYSQTKTPILHRAFDGAAQTKVSWIGSKEILHWNSGFQYSICLKIMILIEYDKIFKQEIIEINEFDTYPALVVLESCWFLNKTRSAYIINGRQYMWNKNIYWFMKQSDFNWSSPWRSE